MTRLPARVGRVALVAVPLAFLGLFFAYPVGSILARGLAPGGHVDLGPVGQVLTDASLRGIAWFTVWQAALSTLL
ncbi:MAG TPA: iron ABC transporter permease, partial [Cellulomonadaceae bacterium]|nr:iron ABC transporter permease [Cellulomonadaceae bacterium]